MEWFNSLNRPFLSPPDWLFTPVWLVLYIMIAASFFLFINGGITKEKRLPLLFFIIQLVFNLLWVPVFFGMQNILGSFMILIFMYIFLWVTIITFFKYSKVASFLLLPYLFWISFACYLNFGYLVLN